MAELDVAFKVFADLKDTVDHIDKRMHRSQPKPIRRPVGTAVVQFAVPQSPLLIKIQDSPAVGRMWFVKKIALFGTDGHTPVTSTTLVQASAAAGGNGTATLPAGAPLTGFTLSFGNVATANSLAVAVTGAQGGTINYAVALAVGQNNPFTVTFPVPLQPAVAGTPIAVAVTGNVNSPTVEISAYTTSNVAVDVYAGAEFDLGGGNPLSDFSSQLIPGAAIPSVTRYGRFDQPVSAHEYIYAWAYNIPASQSVSMVCEVDDWAVDEQEAINV